MIPKQVETLLYKHFGYPKIIISQVATISKFGSDIRSMGLFNIDDEGRMIFLTNQGSHKWSQLLANPSISILMLNAKQDVQIIARGRAELLTHDSNPSLIEKYWIVTPQQAKVTYLHQDPEGEFDSLNNYPTTINLPQNFGVIQITPQFWETLVIDPETYHASNRFIFERKQNGWKEKRLNAI